METVTVNVPHAGEMWLHVARPAGTPDKGIIVIQEAFGVTDYMERMTERFAKQGYLAVSPEMFHRTAPKGATFSYTDYPSIQPHMQAVTLATLSADMRAAFGWLVASGIPEHRIAVLGFCLGGRAAFLANADLPVAASVSFYGGGVAEQLLDRVGDLHAPQLLLWGGKDGHIPPEKTRPIYDALTAAGKPFVDVTFSEAGHAFTRDVGESYHERSAHEAWALVDAFLTNTLG